MSTAGASPSGTCELRGTPTPCCLAELWESCTGLGSCVQGRSMSFATYCFSNGVGLRWEPGPDDSVIGIASRDGNICYTFTTKDGEQTIRDAAGQTVAKVWNALDDYDAQCVGDERETYAYPSPPWHDSCVQGDCQPP